jgi:carbon-monoxide dehydrogenase large subunit
LYGKFLVSIRFFILIANGSIEIDFAAISTSLSKTKTAAGLPTPLYGPVGDFVLERLVDMAAKSISMDPFAIRMKNLIDTKNLPYRIGSGIIWNDAGFKECLEKSKNSNFFKEMIDIKNKKKCNRTWIGYGISTYAELTGIGSKISVAPGMPINTGSETATIEIDGTGSVSGIFAIASHGQGLETTLAQIIADEIGINQRILK